jgi:Flp pilus assembly protein TadG
MVSHHFRRPRGQALVMVTLALIAMFGIIGMAVDLGWSFFVRKAQRAATDAAALAAINQGMKTTGIGGVYSCLGGSLTCAATPLQCPGARGNLEAACDYALLNGFTTTSSQTVTVQASDAVTAPTLLGCTPQVHYPPTAPCVNTPYWVTVKITQQVPQLFSAVTGHPLGTVAAESTAAVAKVLVIGSLILLNRQNDLTGACSTATNLCLQGSPTVNVPGGILLASNGQQAGYIQGGGSVVSPFTYIRPGGGVHLGGAASWQAPPGNMADGSYFEDPFRGMGQPPLNPSQASLPNIAVPGGNLNSSVCPGSVCQPGNYYATASGQPSGAILQVANGIRFSSGASGFGSYVFFGGLNIGQATVTFDPAEYVLAGAASGNMVFNNDNKAMLLGGTGANSDAGRILVLTDSSYGGRLASVTANIAGLPALGFGIASFKSGNNAGSGVYMYGLNPSSSSVPAYLQPFAPVVMWQDQANSNVKYTSSGNVDTSCGGIDTPCTNPTSPNRELQLWATPHTQWGGVIYQPRGAWTVMQASGQYQGALQIVTGSLASTGSGNLTLTSPTNPLERPIAALVE